MQSNIMRRGNMHSNLTKRRFAGRQGRHEKVTSNKLYVFGIPVVMISLGCYIIGAKVIEERMMDNLPAPPTKAASKGDADEDGHDADEDDEEEEDPHIHYLRVRVIDGEILHKYDTLGGSADAYVQIGYDGKRKKTKAVKNSQTPRWNHLIRFKEAKPGKKLTVWVWDYDKLGVDDFIGRATLKPEDLPTEYNEIKEITVPLECPLKEDRGSVRIKLDFTKVNRI